MAAGASRPKGPERRGPARRFSRQHQGVDAKEDEGQNGHGVCVECSWSEAGMRLLTSLSFAQSGGYSGLHSQLTGVKGALLM